jgi:hypothetical protein
MAFVEFDDEHPLADHDAIETQRETRTDQAVVELLLRRQRAYQRVFNGSGSSQDVDLVMLDLGRFCRAFTSTHRADARESANLDGRREVWLRIMDFTRLDVDALYRKYHQQ